MSSGDTPPSRFTSPSSTSASAKKYPGTPKSPMLNNSNNTSSSGNSNTTGNRSSQTRQRLLSSKISAPRPINLPSLRREHAVGTDVPASSPATSHGWGSASSSPSLPQHQQHTHPLNEPDAAEKKHDTETATTTTTHDKSDTSATSPVLIPATATSATSSASATPTRAWAVPTITQASVPPSTDFPTAAEAASSTKKKLSLIDDKEYLKYASSDPNHRSWDEMVSEDMDDFSVDVVEFDDGTKVQVGSDTSSVGSQASASRATTEPVLPSERFTDDYDRSYPPKQPYHHHPYPPAHQQQQQHYHQHHDNDHTHYKPYRRSEDHGYSARYSSNSRRHSATVEGGNERRSSGTSDGRRGASAAASASTTASTRRESTDYGHRRPSYDRKHHDSYHHPTSLLQRPRRLSEQSFRSDHSREDANSNPLHIIPEPTTNDSAEEIIVVQKNLMLTAAERAKKRLEEQEAEFKAAAERAKQKADALAAKQAELAAKQAEPKEKTILKKPAAVAAATSPSPAPAAAAAADKASPLLANATTTTTTTAQTPLPPKLPDTSKPWNLVAAKKQALPPTTPPATTPTEKESAAPASEEKEQAKVPCLETSKESSLETPKEEPVSPPPSRDSTRTQTLKNSDQEQKPITIMKKEPKPAAPKEEKKQKKKEDTQPEDSKSKKPLTEDEKNWQKFVSTIKTDQQAAVKKDVTSMDWNMYADRLQETTAEQDAIAASTRERLIREVEKEIESESQQHKHPQKSQHKQQQPQTVEVFDYDNEEWGPAPASSTNNRGAWTREDSAYSSQRGHRNGRQSSGSGGRAGREGGGRDTGRSNHAKSRADEQKEEKPVRVEILKKQEPVLSKKTRLSNLLKESSSPIFPDFIDKLAAKKPANMSFMMETEESDKEITMMGQDTTPAANANAVPVVEDEAISAATSRTTTTENSPASTPPKSQFSLQQQQQQQHQRRMNVNRHFPVLVYQYPTAQSASTATAAGTTSDHILGSPSSSIDVGSKSPSSHHHHHHHQQQQQQSPQNRPLGVYLMPQQPFLTTNQYVVPYPQVGTTSNVQPIYYPTLSWQQQQTTGMGAPRPAVYDHHQPQHHRRSYNNNNNNNNNNNYSDYSASNGYRQHKYPHNPSSFQNAGNSRGNSYRKRGGGSGAGPSWSGPMMSNAGRGTATAVGRGNGGQYQTTHNAGYSSRKYSRHGIDAAANDSPSSAVGIEQPSL
ncbi:hypothetical protein MBANPS3_005566 [Mucor bainieri]